MARASSRRWISPSTQADISSSSTRTNTAGRTAGVVVIKGVPGGLLGAKIFVATGVVVVAILGGALLLTKRGADRAADESIGLALAATQSAIQDELDGRWQTLQNVTAALAAVPEYYTRIEQALLDDSPSDLIDQADEFVQQIGADWALITDAFGIARASTFDQSIIGEDLSPGSLVGIALDGQNTWGTWIEPGPDGVDLLFQAVGIPLTAPGSRQVAGVLIAAAAIDETFVSDLARNTGSGIVFFVLDTLGVPIVTESTVESEGLQDALSAINADSAFAETEADPIRLVTGDGTLVGVLGALETAAGFPIGGYVGLRSRERELAAYTQLEQTILFVFGGGLVLALISSLLVAGQITRPVKRLVAATQQVSEGQYSGTIDVTSRDEIGQLAAAFQRMVQELKDKQDLVEYLSSAGQTLAIAPDQQQTLVDGATAPAPPVNATGLYAAGAKLANRYEIKDVLGAGGMGVVYRALDTELGETVALKTLRPDAVQADETLLDRFRQEIRLARRITHRNVVRTHDIGEVQGTYYITMEYVEGTTLKDLILKRGQVPIGVTITIGKQLARALEVAHEEGIVHRDIKPQNIVVDAGGFLKVMDFGIARLAERTGGEPGEGLTAVGMAIGTPDYMAPEQLMGEAVDARTDLYAAGVVLFECVSGRLVFDAPTVTALMMQHMQEEPPDPRSLNPRVPEPLARLILKALSKKPEDRWQSAAEMYAALDTIRPDETAA